MSNPTGTANSLDVDALSAPGTGKSLSVIVLLEQIRSGRQARLYGIEPGPSFTVVAPTYVPATPAKLNRGPVTRSRKRT